MRKMLSSAIAVSLAALTAAELAAQYGLGIDLTMGSGWCVGGAWIDKKRAASSGMKVKRAGPGGEGCKPFENGPFAGAVHKSFGCVSCLLTGRGGRRTW